jgi:hypothetical protein
MKFVFLIFTIIISFLVSSQTDTKPVLADTPPMGWNSFQSYGVYLHDEAALANLDVFISKLKPAGYEYFVIDLGMYTFITMRALAASPLMMGGDLPSLDDFSLKLLTNPQMIAYNQNGVMGTLISEKDGIEVWKTNKRNSQNGWIGIFNRTGVKKDIEISKKQLCLGNIKGISIFDVWGNTTIQEGKSTIPPHGVLFLEYSNAR